MTDADIERWKPLRTRVNMGEQLDAAEQEFYDRVLSELDETETFPGLDREIAALNLRLEKLRREAIELRDREKQLDDELAALEADYLRVVGKPLLAA